MSGPADSSTSGAADPVAPPVTDKPPRGEESEMAKKETAPEPIRLPGTTADLETEQLPPAYWMRSIDDPTQYRPAFSYGSMQDHLHNRYEIADHAPEGMPAATGGPR